MTPQSGKQTIAIRLLHNISRSKGNQTIKYQLIQYNMKNVFLKKSYTKSGGETIPRPVCKSPKLKKPEYGSVA